MSFLVSLFCSISLFASMCSPQLGALSILKASQGGTGIGTATAGDVGKVLKVSDDDPFTFILDTDNTGAGGSFPFDIKTNFGSTTFSSTTPYWARTGLFASSTSYFDSFFATNGTTTNFTAHRIYSDASDGLLIEANNGTDVAILGAGNSANSTFYGGVNIDGTTRLATSLTGLAYTTSGTVSAVTNGTGGQILAMVDGVPAFVATTTFSSGLSYSAGNVTNTGVLSITATSPITRDTATGAVTIACATCLTASGAVTSLSGTANQITASASVGAVTLSLPNQVNFPLGFSSAQGSTTNATSTNLHITGLSAGGLGVDGNGKVYSGATTTAGTGLTYSGNAFNVNTTQNITALSNLTTNALVLTGSGNGTLAAYTGTTCTNQFVRVLSALGVATCASVDLQNDTTSTLLVNKGGTGNTSFTASQLIYGNGTNALSSVATGTLSASSPLSLDGTTVIVGTSRTLSLGTVGVLNGGTGGTAWGQGWFGVNDAGAFVSSTSPTFNYITATSTTATSSFAGGVSVGTTIRFPGLLGCDTLDTNASGYVVCGTDASGGGGSASDKFATTSDTFGIYPNAALNTLLGLGTTTPKVTLTISSSTRSQLSLTDASLTSNQWNFRSHAGNLMIATSSASTYATSTRSAIEIDTNGTLTLGKALTAVNGGTGNVTYATGDLLYASDASTLTRLPIGGASTCLTVSGGIPAWSTCASGGAFQYNGWATTSPFTGSIILYPLSPDSDVVIGSQSSTTAPFWWDESATTTYIGNGGAGDSLVSLGTDGNEWTFGNDATDKSFRIASSTSIGSALTDIFSITKSLVVTIGNTLASILNVIGVGNSYSYAVATTTLGNGVFPGLFIEATSTQWNNIGINFMVATTSDYGIESPYLATFDGPMTTNEWQSEFCTTAAGELTQVVADTIRGCGRYYYVEDANGAVDFAQLGGENYFRLRAGATGASNVSGDGMGISMASAFLSAASSTPLMDVKFRQGTMENATSTINMQLRVGFQSTTGLSPDYAAANQVGCYFTASTTKANWIAVCRDTNETNIDTGIASSTVKTGNGGWFRGYITINGTVAKFQLISLKDGKKAEVTIASNVPQTTLLNPTLSMAKTGVTSVQNELQFQWLRVWYRLPNTH